MNLSSEASPLDRVKVYRQIVREWENLDAGVWFVGPYAFKAYMGLNQVQGAADWKDGEYRILIANNLTIGEEVKTLAHEVSHILLGHVAKANIQHEDAVQSAGEILSAGVSHKEDPADALASKLLARWCARGLRIN